MSGELLSRLTNPEVRLGEFSIPWGLAVGALGFLLAWAVVSLMERKGWTRNVWHLPLFFVVLAVLFGSTLGLLLAP